MVLLFVDWCDVVWVWLYVCCVGVWLLVVCCGVGVDGYCCDYFYEFD